MSGPYGGAAIKSRMVDALIINTPAAIAYSWKQCMRFYGHLLLQWEMILDKAAEAIDRLRIEKTA